MLYVEVLFHRVNGSPYTWPCVIYPTLTYSRSTGCMTGCSGSIVPCSTLRGMHHSSGTSIKWFLHEIRDAETHKHPIGEFTAGDNITLKEWEFVTRMPGKCQMCQLQQYTVQCLVFDVLILKQTAKETKERSLSLYYHDVRLYIMAWDTIEKPYTYNREFQNSASYAYALEVEVSWNISSAIKSGFV